MSIQEGCEAVSKALFGANPNVRSAGMPVVPTASKRRVSNPLSILI